MSGDYFDWKEIAVTLSASNAKLCEIALKADELAAAIGRCDAHPNKSNRSAVLRALIDFKVARTGQ